MGSPRYLATSQHLPAGAPPGTGREKAWPPAGLRGTQSVKATATGPPVGFDTGKRVKGHRRLVLTGPLGHVLASRVLTADRPATTAFWDEVAALHDLPGPAQVVFGDRSFNGVAREHLARGSGMRVEKPIRVRVEKMNGCMPAWPWTVGRTFT